MDNTYNGWTNRETWLVGLWFNPETKSDIDYLEETLEAEFLTIMETASRSIDPSHQPAANIYVDMIDFNCINWDELREAQEDEEE